MKSFNDLSGWKQIGIIANCTLLLILALFQLFMVFWVTFGYPPPNRSWQDLLGIALLCCLPVLQFIGLSFIFLPQKAVIGFRLVIGNIAVFCCLIIYMMIKTSIYTKTTAVVFGIWMAILFPECCAAANLKRFVSAEHNVSTNF